MKDLREKYAQEFNFGTIELETAAYGPSPNTQLAIWKTVLIVDIDEKHKLARPTNQ
jgi:hypothetical protein